MQRPRVTFNDFYADLFGERWTDLAAALAKDGEPLAYRHRLVKPYYLDAASAAVALAAGPVGDGDALDLCAAPGGKTLVLASTLAAGGRLVANERSSARRDRLRRVLDGHLPVDLRAQVTVTGHDAAKWGLYERDRYDLVLLDAPCSSERHLLGSPTHLAEWSPARSGRLAQQAYAMLLAAIHAVKPGGRVIYSTCALAPNENDGVVERALGRLPGARIAGGAGRATGFQPESLETTAFGTQIRPDRASGAGPIYFALLTKSDPGV